MIPVDMAFQDLTGTGIMYMRTACIWYIRRFVYNSRKACIFQAPGRVLIMSRRNFCNDGIFETSLFKSALPVVYTLNKEWYPFFGSSRIYVEYDRFCGFYKFPAFIFFK